MVHKEMINFTLGFIAGMITIVGLIWFAIGSDQ
jgi:hypothetical protein